MAWVADLEYVITGQDGQWRLWWQGQCCGSFPSRRAALAMAAWEAARVRLLGHRVRILVRRRDGGFRVVPPLSRPCAEALPPPPGASASQRPGTFPAGELRAPLGRGHRRTRAARGLAPA